jgi:hypothetical protein
MKMSSQEKLIDEITNGLHNGKSFWICDLRYVNGYNRKPARNVKPALAEIRSTKDREDVYYSDSAFFVKSKMIKVFDNTGYRSYRGIPLMVFESEMECKEHYNSQLQNAIDSLTVAKGTAISQLNVIIEKFEKEKV